MSTSPDRLQRLARASQLVQATGSLEGALDAITSEAQDLVGTHQAVTSLTVAADWSQAITSVRLSDKYAAWRSYAAEPNGTGIYSLVCRTNTPLRLTQIELEAHPAWRHFGREANRHPPLRGLLAAPLVGRDGHNLGLIQLSDKADGTDFAADDEAALVQLAEMASAAVEKALADAAIAGMPGLFYVFDEQGKFLRWNKGFEEASGYAAEEIARLHPRKLFAGEDRRRVEEMIGAAFTRGEAAAEAALTTRDGRRRHYLFSVRAVRLGGVRCLVGTGVAIEDRLRLEWQLRHSQKLEAIGQLAGGVAHDFNNLLTVINGYCELVLNRLGDEDPVRQMVAEVVKAGDRAAQLTQQLLAFSRQQKPEPRPLDLNGAILDMDKMLRRLIGEDVLLDNVLDPHLGLIQADPGQLQQVLVNLVVNARDAMPRGGRLTVETQRVTLGEADRRLHPNVRPGAYALLAVSDNGVGMDEATKARIFEPFFTTKGPGKGTGLGLATVYGIVKQAGGQIEVYSEPGRGTTFKVYFPQVEGSAPGGELTLERPAMPPGTETVLLVEDEEPLRALAGHALRSCGYTVLEAAHGEEAVRLAAETSGAIHLLVSDVVMPHLGGRQLYDRLRDARPGLRVLFMSGYTGEAVMRHGLIGGEFAFLQKPFTPTALARKVRDVLDRDPV